MKAFLAGRGFTYAIIGLYSLRTLSYAYSGNWPRVIYWLSAIGIVVSAEFLVSNK